jgi:hypothetical protein
MRGFSLAVEIKTCVMKQKQPLHEILIFTGTSFSSKEFSEREQQKNLNGSPTEQLEKACWSGLLFELLPEILGNSFHRHENFIWEVMPANHFIRVCLGPAPAVPETKSCLDPYFCIPTHNSN